jgi:hypothetical protein
VQPTNDTSELGVVRPAIQATLVRRQDDTSLYQRATAILNEKRGEDREKGEGKS